MVQLSGIDALVLLGLRAWPACGRPRTKDSECYVIIVYAGAQVDAPGREVPRFPADVEDELFVRLRGLMQSLKPSLLIGALAAGADILFARAALEEGIPVQIELPFARDAFRLSSVASRGEPWTGHYDRIMESPNVKVVEGSFEVKDDSDTFTAHNLAILDAAGSVAETRGERIWVLTVRPTPTKDAPSVTDDMVHRAEGRGHLTLDLSPTRRSISAFIVMPYGVKREAATGRDINCDPPFHKVYRPLMEDADVEWTRADLETDSGIIHSSMLSSLANSDLALVDLTTANFNVGYELGVRHVFAAHSTILMNPYISTAPRNPPPFDINLIRVHSFERDEGISDEQAEEAIRKLRPVVSQAVSEAKIDSPAHDWFTIDHIARPFPQRSALPQRERQAASARERVNEAVKRSDAASMISEAAWLDTALEIPEATRRALRIQLAVSLIDEGAYPEAHDLLELARPAVDDPMHRLWMQKTIMVHRRLGEQHADVAARQAARNTALSLLSEAEEAGYADSETYGMWGGLIKRQLDDSAILDDPAIRSFLFDEMAEKYKAGFELDPHFYTGINLVMALRLGSHEDSESSRAQLKEIMTVTRFLVRLALKHDPKNYWALVTLAEISLHESLEYGGAFDDTARQFAEAARHGRPDQISTTTFQLDFLASHGAPRSITERLKQILNGL